MKAVCTVCDALDVHRSVEQPRPTAGEEKNPKNKFKAFCGSKFRLLIESKTEEVNKMIQITVQ